MYYMKIIKFSIFNFRYNYQFLQFVLLMSRIIVTNIPKFVSEKQLKQHFKDLGEITDCKIVKDQKGQSRKFGFVGFKDVNGAGLAQKKYDKTYLGVSKIKVEKAKTRDEEQVKRKMNNSNEDQPRSKKQEKQSQQKFNKYKKIVQEGVKKSWDDLVIPESSKAASKQQIKQLQKTSKKFRKEQKKQQKQQSLQKQKQQKPIQNKQQEIKGIKAPKLSQKNKKYISSPLAIDETRLYVTNIPYNINEEEVTKYFSKFGTIKKVKVPIEYDGQSKGYAFVTFQLPQEALRAFIGTDNKVVFGRIVHVKPAVQDIGEIIKNSKQAEYEQKKKQLYGEIEMDQKTSFKKKKKKQMRDRLNDTTSWNTLFLNPNTILERMSEKLGLEKSEILVSEDLAPKMALAQAQVIQQTKQWMISEGLNLQFLEIDRNLCKRSDTIILVKNLNFRTSQAQIKQLFQFYGLVNKVILSPNRAICIVEYSSKQFAENAMQKLQNIKFKNNFIYLEYAPIDMLRHQDLIKQQQQIQEEIIQAQELSKVIYIKNLNFQTQQSMLFEHIQKVQQPKSVTIVRDKTGKSMGYGFAEFANNQQALKTIKRLQSQILDGHRLMLSISKKKVDTQKYQKIKQLKQKISKCQPTSSKLIIKNIAFQATKNDIKQTFKHMGSIKSIKLPKKMNGEHRGFGFVEFDTAQQAALAKEALGSTHLYGRKLVIEYEMGTQGEAAGKNGL